MSEFCLENEGKREGPGGSGRSLVKVFTESRESIIHYNTSFGAVKRKTDNWKEKGDSPCGRPFMGLPAPSRPRPPPFPARGATPAAAPRLARRGPSRGGGAGATHSRSTPSRPGRSAGKTRPASTPCRPAALPPPQPRDAA